MDDLFATVQGLLSDLGIEVVRGGFWIVLTGLVLVLVYRVLQLVYRSLRAALSYARGQVERKPPELAAGLALLAGPVLLVDDYVDSGWTMALVARELRQAGASGVLPLALALGGLTRPRGRLPQSSLPRAPQQSPPPRHGEGHILSRGGLLGCVHAAYSPNDQS